MIFVIIITLIFAKIGSMIFKGKRPISVMDRSFYNLTRWSIFLKIFQFIHPYLIIGATLQIQNFSTGTPFLTASTIIAIIFLLYLVTFPVQVYNLLIKNKIKKDFPEFKNKYEGFYEDYKHSGFIPSIFVVI